MSKESDELQQYKLDEIVQNRIKDCKETQDKITRAMAKRINALEMKNLQYNTAIGIFKWIIGIGVANIMLLSILKVFEVLAK